MSQIKQTLSEIDASVADLVATGLTSPTVEEFREAMEIILLGTPDKALLTMYKLMGAWEVAAWRILYRSFKISDYKLYPDLYTQEK
jgi:hypothetical protein